MNTTGYQLIEDISESHKSTPVIVTDDDESSFLSVSAKETQRNILNTDDYQHKFFADSPLSETTELQQSSLNRFYKLAKTQKWYMSLSIVFQIIQVLLALTGPAFVGIVIHLSSDPDTFDYKSNYFSRLGCYISSSITNHKYNCNHLTSVYDIKQVLIMFVIIYLFFQFLCCIFTA
eukprot:128657_1